MRLLVSCPRQVFLVDARSREVSVVDAGQPEYYGLSWTHDGEEIASGHSGVDHATLVSWEDYIESERGHLRLGSRQGVDCLSAPHQILCTEERVLVTNTGRNCLTVVRNDDLSYRHVWLDDVRWDRKGGDSYVGKHLNSVFLDGDRLLVLAHNHHRPSMIAELTWPGLEFVRWIQTKASQAHNIWPQPGGEILVCDSLQGSLIDAQDGRVVWKARNRRGISRGLACAGKQVFVGMSEFTGRQGRATSDGGIWVLDRDTWQEIDFLPLPGAGNVHEVRLIDEPDECHHRRPLRRVPQPQEEATAAYHALLRKRSGCGTAVLPYVLPAAPEGWTAQVGEGLLVEGELQPAAEERPMLLTRDGVDAEDVVVAARFRIEPLPGHRHVGLVARHAGPEDMNMLCAMIEVVSASATASIWLNADGHWERLAHAAVPWPPTEMRFEAQGPRLALRVNGEQVVLQVECSSLPRGGKVGVRATTGRIAGFTAEAFGAARPDLPAVAAPPVRTPARLADRAAAWRRTAAPGARKHASSSGGPAGPPRSASPAAVA